MRRALNRNRSRARPVSIPAPRNGLVLNQNPAQPVPDSAEVLDNWWPTNKGVRVRGGLQASATTGAEVTSLFAYDTSSTPNLFAATASAIYDISSLDPDTVPTAEITGQTSGYYSTELMGTVGGEFLYVVNGTDSAQLYDGSSWTTVTDVSSPAITGVTTSGLSAVWKYRNRLFFVEKDTKAAWYLPVDSVGGAAQSVSLAGVFQSGGSLLFGATWSLDSGDGLDDKCVFVSADGEVAIYQGSDPSGSDWGIVGRYDIAKPLGVNCTMQAGGDLMIATVDGVVPLSQVINKDPAALSMSAVSRPIEPLWNFEARRATSSVELIKWSQRGLGVVTLPDAQRVLVVNLQTGGWGVAQGWTATCGTVFADKCYIGTEDGTIFAIDETGLDGTSPYTAKLCHTFLGDGRYLSAQQVRHVFFAPESFILKTSVATDYNASDFPSAPSDAGLSLSDTYMVWDVSNWDEKNWWSEDIEEGTGAVTTQWMSVSGSGHALASQLQITSGQTVKPSIELVRTDILYREGRFVT